MRIYKRVLVTGGAGFIGSHLSKRLLEMGLEVYVIDNLSTGNIKNLAPGVNFFKGDILDQSMIKSIMDEGIEIVFHNAANVTIRGSVDNFCKDAENNVIGTLSVLRACERSKVRKFIFASSMAVYGDSEKPVPAGEKHKIAPLSPYGISKFASEMYIENICRSLGLYHVILRYFNTYGPGQAFTPYVGVITIFINRLLKGEPLTVFGDGNQCRDFVYIDDIIQSNIKAMEADINSGTFNIGSGEGHTVNEVAGILMKQLGSNADIVYSARKAEELTNSIADITHARSILAYSPLFRFPDNIEKVIELIKDSQGVSS